MYNRILDFKDILKRKSLFLLGPRQSGKTTYLNHVYKESFSINLLKASEFLKYKTNPELFGQEIQFQIKNYNKKLFIVDEIQKIPELLDEVHHLIESYKQVRFILTGSSVRKLKKSGINLLGGRASRIHFHPIVSVEYGFENFEKNLFKNMTYGFLPSILDSEDPWSDLEDYVALYLKEEVQQEAIVRSLNGFSRFLNLVATTSGQQLNFTELGNDAQVPPRTVREYYQVLEDTLIGSLLLPYEKTIKRKAVATSKFYLFDLGVTNYLLGRKTISSKTNEFGLLLEQMIYCEIKAYLDYHRRNESLFYWRSTSQFEVDFLIRDSNDRWTAVEVKSSANPTRHDFKGILALEEDLKLKRKIIVCMATLPRLLENKIEVFPVCKFLEMLWADEIV